MKALNIARAFGASFALVLVGALGYALATVNIPLPGTNGPFLGDTVTNLYTVLQGAQNNQLSQYTSYTTQTGGVPGSTQPNCQPLGYGMSFLTYALSGTGSVCLPQAKGGTSLQIANQTGQTINIFTITPTSQSLGAGAPNDYINGTVGTTAYTGLTNGKNADCFVPQNGNWWCTSGN